MMAALLALSGCSQKPAPAAQIDGGAPAASVVASSATAAATAHFSERCADCHEPMYEEWKTSSHAAAATDPLYLTALAGSPRTERCAGCHTPLEGHVAPGPAVAEGVSCEACHAIREVSEQGAIDLQVGFAKLGPLRDAKRHYFHDMEYSGLYKESRYCGGCHQWSETSPTGEPIPVLTEYSEWRESAGKKSISCQDCHMPTSAREAARGSPIRPLTGHHGFSAGKRAIALTLAAHDDHGKLVVKVSLRNQGGGHAVPTGIPGKQLVLRVTAVDAAGAELGHDERVFSRVLVDDHGAEVPFYLARKMASDTRLPADKTHDEAFTFEVKPAGELRAELVDRPLSPALQKALGAGEIKDVVVASLKLPFGAAGPGGRAQLPKSVSFAP